MVSSSLSQDSMCGSKEPAVSQIVQADALPVRSAAEMAEGCTLHELMTLAEIARDHVEGYRMRIYSERHPDLAADFIAARHLWEQNMLRYQEAIRIKHEL